MNFDYLYEFSETRKVLEEFFKSGAENQDTQQLQFQVSINIYIFFSQSLHGKCLSHEKFFLIKIRQDCTLQYINIF